MVAPGLYGPRGLKFGPDGDLYVATSGTGGTNSTGPKPEGPGHVPLQVPAAVGGPYTETTSSIVRYDPHGDVSTLAARIPFDIQSRPEGGFGVADVAFLDGEMYALIAGGGCGHGNPDSRTWWRR